MAVVKKIRIFYINRHVIKGYNMATTVSKFEGSNFLQPTGFKVVVNRDRFKNLEFFAQSLQHPDVSVSPAIQSFRRANVYLPGDKAEYGTLTIDTILDENMNVYKEMHSWLIAGVDKKQVPSDANTIQSQDKSFYDISVLVLSSHNNTIDTIRYKDAFPTNVGTINFQSTVDGVQFITFPVTFAYTTFTISD
tara:strand:+ start:1102 stop:1677 length:576 start_codon:yes stop_codon:yes gene_type:complete